MKVSDLRASQKSSSPYKLKSQQNTVGVNALTSSTLLSDNIKVGDASLERRKILVTGCSSGIGYYCAKRLHKDGHVVVASCRRMVDVLRLRDEGLHAVLIDLDSSDSIDEGIGDALAITNGELDVLISNGAYGQPGAVEDLSRSTLERQFSTNVFGTHELTVKLIPVLLLSAKPRIIQVSSVLGLIALRYRGAYVASKFALEGLTDALRLELSDTKVKVVLIEPGPIVSSFRKNAKKALFDNIDIENSRHIDRYKRAMRRFDSEKRQPFTLPESAVYKKLDHAINAKRPNLRYYVTFPTFLFGVLRRLLSARLLDALLLRISDGEDKRFDKR